MIIFIKLIQFIRSRQVSFVRLYRQWGEPKPVLLGLSVQRNHREAGFILIEIMVVIVIIGILAALIVPNIMGRPDEARLTAAHGTSIKATDDGMVVGYGIR